MAGRKCVPARRSCWSRDCLIWAVLVAGRLSQRHLLDGNLPECDADSPVVRRRRAGRVSGFRFRSQRQRAARRQSDRSAFVGPGKQGVPGGSCPMATIPTASLSAAAEMPISSGFCCRGRTHDLRHGSSGRTRQRPEPVSRDRSDRPAAGRLDQPLFWISAASVAWPGTRCAAMLWTCCTSCAGGRASHALTK